MGRILCRRLKFATGHCTWQSGLCCHDPLRSGPKSQQIRPPSPPPRLTTSRLAEVRLHTSAVWAFWNYPCLYMGVCPACPYIRGERLGASEHASGGGRAAPLPASLSLPCVESTRRRPRAPQAWPVPVPRGCVPAFPTLPLLLKRVVSARAPGPAQVQAPARALTSARARTRACS